MRARKNWMAAEISQLREDYPEAEIERVMIGLPNRTLNAIRLKASRLNILRVTPSLDIFLFI